MPPPPVRVLAVFGTGAPARSSLARLPRPPSSASTSRTTMPLPLPVGSPTLAEGCRLHHRSIARRSVVASQWPLRVRRLCLLYLSGSAGAVGATDTVSTNADCDNGAILRSSARFRRGHECTARCVAWAGGAKNEQRPPRTRGIRRVEGGEERIDEVRQ